MAFSKIIGVDKLFSEINEDRTLNSKEKEDHLNELKELETKLLDPGDESDQDYSGIYNMSFIDFWETSDERRHFDEYKDRFSEQLMNSSDPESKIALEIQRLDIHNLGVFPDLSLGIDEREPWIGELIAVKGENPSLFELIFELEEYAFLAKHRKALGSWELPIRTTKYLKYFISIKRPIIFSMLGRVCYGYTEQRKHAFLRSLQNDPNAELDPDNAKGYQPIKFKFMTEKMAWLHELKILELIMERTKKGNTYNYLGAAKVICSIIDCQDPEKDVGTIRNNLRGLFSHSKTVNMNNPFNTKKNVAFVEKLKKDFDLE